MTADGAIIGTAVFLPQLQTPCLVKLNRRRSWTPTMAIDTGGTCVGIRASSPSVRERIERRLWGARAPWLDHLAPPNFTVEAPDDALGWRRGLHVLYRDHVPVARGKSLDHVLAALGEQVTAARRATSSTRTAVRASVLVTEGRGALLLPWEWHQDLLDRERRLGDLGIQLLAPDMHPLGRAGHLLLPEQFPDPRDRSVRIALWCLKIAGPREKPLLRPAQGVQLAFGSVVNRQQVGVAAVLRSLADLAAEVAFMGVPVDAGRDLVATAHRLLTR